MKKVSSVLHRKITDEAKEVMGSDGKRVMEVRRAKTAFKEKNVILNSGQRVISPK